MSVRKSLGAQPTVQSPEFLSPGQRRGLTGFCAKKRRADSWMTDTSAAAFSAARFRVDSMTSGMMAAPKIAVTPITIPNSMSVAPLGEAELRVDTMSLNCTSVRHRQCASTAAFHTPKEERPPVSPRNCSTEKSRRVGRLRWAAGTWRHMRPEAATR